MLKKTMFLLAALAACVLSTACPVGPDGDGHNLGEGEGEEGEGEGEEPFEATIPLSFPMSIDTIDVNGELFPCGGDTHMLVVPEPGDYPLKPIATDVECITKIISVTEPGLNPPEDWVPGMGHCEHAPSGTWINVDDATEVRTLVTHEAEVDGEDAVILDGLPVNAVVVIEGVGYVEVPNSDRYMTVIVDSSLTEVSYIRCDSVDCAAEVVLAPQ